MVLLVEEFVRGRRGGVLVMVVVVVMVRGRRRGESWGVDCDVV
jgi:hypothetical protein